VWEVLTSTSPAPPPATSPPGAGGHAERRDA
jgi:hypothetical protein